jgi:uncharacterized membrane protein YccC
MPPLFALFLYAFDNDEAALFASFGAFAFLGFADFGGPPRHRTNAYLALTFVGAVLVAGGTLMSNEALVVGIVGIAVAGGVRFLGSFGGYFQASVSPLILAYVLAASVPAPGSTVPDRVLGWVVAGLVCTVAALVLWPRRERLKLRAAARDAATALADHVEQLATTAGPTEETLAATERTVADLEASSNVAQRPAGPSAHDAALSFLVDQLERVAVFVRTHRRRRVPEDAAPLATLAAETLRAIARTLASATPPDDVDAQVKACLDAKLGVVERAVDAIGRGEDPGAVLDRIDDLVPERIILLLAGSALANASIVVSGHAPSTGTVSIPLEVPLTAGVRGTLGRLRHLVAANAVPTSAYAQDAVRAGVAIGAALFLAGELRLDHGFWVVLGTLSVLRSNAFETGRSAVFASLGTAIGFAVSAALLALVGFDDVGLWIVVIAGFFLSAYTPQVLGFVAGQVSFTIAVVAMFNLLLPEGWHTGLVRLENILIGASVSAVVALVFWPRRASVELRANIATLYRDLSTELPERIGRVDTPDEVSRAELRAHAGYVQYLAETARNPQGRGSWATLLADAAQVRFALDLLPRHRGYAGLRSCGPTRTAFAASVQDVAAGLAATAAGLERHPGGHGADVGALAAATRAPIVDCLQHHAHDDSQGVLKAGVDAALVRDLLVDAAVLTDDALGTVPKLPD